MFLAALCVVAAAVPVIDHPDGEAFLLFELLPDGTALLALSPDGEVAVTGFAQFPYGFNPAKSSAVFLPEESAIEVTSQFPFSSVYVTASYAVSGTVLTLVGSSVVDPYPGQYDEIVSLLDLGDLEGAAAASEEIMYPGAMPNGRELCLRFLDAAFRCARSGGGVECFQAVDRASIGLLGRPAHQILGPGDPIPGACITAREYNDALEAYAAALEQAGNPSMAAAVRSGKI